MIPDRDRPDTLQNNPDKTELPETERTSYRPDWIIPDNGISSGNREHANEPRPSKESGHAPQNGEETLGIP